MTRSERPRTALVTGSNSGIGRATAQRLLASGWRVYATARRPEAAAELAQRGATILPLDVTDEVSMVDAVQAVTDAGDTVTGLVNNAGYGLYGPVETTSMDDIRRQFETNVFGLVRLCQLVLPDMRRAGGGRIVNISSMGGRFTMPGGAFYHASKHALEAISDALRFEVAGFGVHVSLVEPGPVITEWVDTATQARQVEDGPYARFTEAMLTTVRSGYKGPLGKLASSPERVANVIERALTARRPRTRYLVGPVARALVTTNALLPDRAWDAVMKTQYHQPQTS